MNKIADYAIGLVAGGGESIAEDDMNEDEVFADHERKQWLEARDLGVHMAQAVGNHRESFLAWYRSVEPSAMADG